MSMESFFYSILCLLSLNVCRFLVTYSLDSPDFGYVQWSLVHSEGKALKAGLWLSTQLPRNVSLSEMVAQFQCHTHMAVGACICIYFKFSLVFAFLKGQHNRKFTINHLFFFFF